MGNTSEAPYRVLPKLKVFPETADIDTNTYMSFSGWGGEPPYLMEVIEGEEDFFRIAEFLWQLPFRVKSRSE